MATRRSSGKGAVSRLTPLGIVGTFLTFTEVVIGIAVTQASGSVQVALTIFVATFPVLVAAAFFYILWHRPYVFYPPGEYVDVDVAHFVGAIRRRQDDELNTLGMMRTILESNAETPEAKKFVALALQQVQEQILSVDLSPITNSRGSSFLTPYRPECPVHEFLDDLWLVLSEHIPPHSFGSVWGLRDIKSGRVFSDMGSRWAKRHFKSEDGRTLKELGIVPTMNLEAIALPI